MVTLESIAGYAGERIIWKLLLALTEKGRRYDLNNLKAKDICIVEDRFAIRETETAAVSEKTAVRNIGVLAFYALIGVEAAGEGNAVPKIASAHADEELASLVNSCLNGSCTSLDRIHAAAEAALSREPVRKERLASSSGRSYQESLVKFWPEEMLSALILFLCLMFPSVSAAQDRLVCITSEMEELVNRCVRLRTASNVEAVTEDFDYDMEWTLLDEIEIDRDGECTVKDPVRMLGVNEICGRILKSQKGALNTGGRFVNGQDPRYRYSLIEVTAKAGASLTYEITGRQGTQTFAVVPCDPEAEFRFSLEKDGVSVGEQQFKDGVCYLTTGMKMKHEDRFVIKIYNASGRNMAFVIVNHNARD